MNEVFENNVAITSIRNFYMNYKKVILGIAALVILIISAYLINSQITKMNNLEAAEIYHKWIAQETETDEGKLASEELFADLISSYKKTGYAKIALLNYASSKAKNGDLDLALNYFLLLKESSEGIGRNRLFNKIARINLARILITQEKFDNALNMLDIYTSENDALMHEIIGDILSKQDKKDLAIEQYNIAKQNYMDEASISIVTMKISNLSI
jgi:predicted negative regulator of RcsB-dependent stress response